MVQDVAELVALGPQVAEVVLLRRHLDRHRRGDRQAVALEPDDLARVVGQQADGREAEVGEDLRADAVVAQVGREAELEVGLDRVEALLLQLVGAELVEQADAAALLGEVEQDAATLRPSICSQRLLELRAAVAAQRAEHVAGHALRVHADEHVLAAVDVALDQREMVLVVDQLAEADRAELACTVGSAHGRLALDELLGAAAVRDQVRDGAELQPVLGAERRRGRARGPSCRRPS